MYHTGSAILGVLIARASGQRFEDFLEERIFAPLGMKDTAFFAPEAKIERLATSYRTDDRTDRLTVFDDFPGFGQMLLDFGLFGSERISLGRSGSCALIGKGFDHTAIADAAMTAFVHHMLQFFAESCEFGDAPVHIDHVMARNAVGFGAGSFGLRAQIQQLSNRIQFEAKLAGVTDEVQSGDLGRTVAALFAGRARRRRI